MTALHSGKMYMLSSFPLRSILTSHLYSFGKTDTEYSIIIIVFMLYFSYLEEEYHLEQKQMLLNRKDKF